MARYLPTRPGWYRNPDEPRSLRYWDGKSWTGRSRSQPAWAKRAEPFELVEDELDRSAEGPVHPHELREPVATGAWPGTCSGRGGPGRRMGGTGVAGTLRARWPHRDRNPWCGSGRPAGRWSYWPPW